MLAALENGVKGGKWYSLMDKVYRLTTLQAAWKKVASNKGAAGVDEMSCKRFEEHSERYLKELSEALRQGTYRPQAVRRVYIPKGRDKRRPLGIPTVKDRVVQKALQMVLEPIFEWEFEPVSYGFRPGRGSKDALREVDHWLKEGYHWVVDADLASYFDTIPHGRLLEKVRHNISDSQVLRLVGTYLKQQVMEGAKHWTPEQGSPQGAVISPLLANLYLHDLDTHLSNQGYKMVRFADDFVVLCKSAIQAESALAEVQTWVESNGLELHPEKTHVGDCRQPEQGFEFLGYRFEAGRRWVRRKSQKALKDKIRVKTGRSKGASMQAIIEDLNPTLRGWFGYFKHAEPYTFKQIDGFVRRRLRAIRRKQSKRPGSGRSFQDHQRWPNAYFAKHGLFTMSEARAELLLARRSR
jgi:RNA-directed DNA polymerase